MVVEFRFPDVGEGITEGEVVKWLVKEGDQVKEHQAIAKIETDKAIAEIPSPASGTILKIYYKEGDTIKVGEVLVTIGEGGEQIPETKPTAKPVEAKKAPIIKPAGAVGYLEEAPEEEEVKSVPKVPQKKEEITILATPAVRRLVRELKVDLSKIIGTGKEGRITEEDMRRAVGVVEEVHPEEAKKIEMKIVKKYNIYGYIEHVPVKGVRKVTAKKMVQSATEIPHVTHMDLVDVTELWNHREKEKIKMTEKGIHLTFLPFIVKACVAALKKHPYLNATYDTEHEEIILKKYYNIGVAVDTPDGLIVPVIKGAEQKSILNLANEIEELAKKAIERKVDLADLRGGTFTITNIGVFGGTYATPIINYPECAILGAGKIYDDLKLDNGKVKLRKILPLSLSFDHRILDGAEAARFVNDLKAYLEDIDLLLIE